MTLRSAVLLGATGLVGGHCLDLLLADPRWGWVTVLGRRRLPRENQKLQQRVLELDQLAAHADALGADDIFSCLGTTIKRAGSQEAFRRVDFDYVTSAAQIAVASGAEQFGLVSAAGADPGSRVFYSRVKGEAEATVRGLPFRAVYLLRPSLLLGKRRELRLGERIAEVVARPIGPLLRGPLSRYRPVPARAVASAMVRLMAERRAGVHVVESEEICNLAET